MRLTAGVAQRQPQGGSAADRREKGGLPGGGRVGRIGSWLWKAATGVAIAAAAILADRLVRAGVERDALLERLMRAENLRDEFSRLPITKGVPAHRLVQGPLLSKLRPEFKEVVRDDEESLSCSVTPEEDMFRRQSWVDVWTDFFGKDVVNVKIDWAIPHAEEPEWVTRMRVYQDEICEYGKGLEHKIGCEDWWKIRCGHRTEDTERCADDCVRRSKEAAWGFTEEDPWFVTAEF